MNSNDKRTMKTEAALHEALINLLMEKDISRITVKEVTEKAEIHRITFYAHYQDIYELYEEIKQKALKEISDFVSADSNHQYEEYYAQIAHYAYENKWIFHIIFNNPSIQSQAVNILEERYLKIWLYEDHLSEITSEMRYMTAYNIEGCIGILKHWWQDNYSEPIEKVIGYLRRANRIFDAVSLN